LESRNGFALEQIIRAGRDPVRRSLENRLTSRTYAGQSSELRVDYTYNAQGLVATEKRYSDLAGTTLIAETDIAYGANGNELDAETAF
jgi:hypothetical protein